MQGVFANRLGRWLAGWGGSASALAIAGPFGTFASMGLADRALFWGAVTATAFLMAAGFAFVLDRYLSHLTTLRRAVIMGLAMAIGFTPFLHGIKLVFLDGRPSPLGPLGMAVAVFVVPLAVGMVRAWPEPARTAAPPDPDPDPAPAPDPVAEQAVADVGEAVPEQRLIDRLDVSVRGRILTVSGRDHYVDLRTDAGEAALLMRFSDALRELDGVEGAQIHRSHWVADAAVLGLERRAGKLVVVLRSGPSLPVSRTFQKAALERWPLADSPAPPPV